MNALLTFERLFKIVRRIETERHSGWNYNVFNCICLSRIYALMCHSKECKGQWRHSEGNIDIARISIFFVFIRLCLTKSFNRYLFEIILCQLYTCFNFSIVFLDLNCQIKQLSLDSNEEAVLWLQVRVVDTDQMGTFLLVGKEPITHNCIAIDCTLLNSIQGEPFACCHLLKLAPNCTLLANICSEGLSTAILNFLIVVLANLILVGACDGIMML